MSEQLFLLFLLLAKWKVWWSSFKKLQNAWQKKLARSQHLELNLSSKTFLENLAWTHLLLAHLGLMLNRSHHQVKWVFCLLYNVVNYWNLTFDKKWSIFQFFHAFNLFIILIHFPTSLESMFVKHASAVGTRKISEMLTITFAMIPGNNSYVMI